MTFSKIVVATDFSTCSKTALRTAMEIGSKLEASITLCHVVASLTYSPLDKSLFGSDRPKYTLSEYLQEAARRELATFVADVPGAEDIESVVRAGDPVQSILDVVQDGGYDLLVMGARGRSKLGHFLMGSVAERVVRAAKCAVLTVPGQE